MFEPLLIIESLSKITLIKINNVLDELLCLTKLKEQNKVVVHCYPIYY